MGTFDKAKFFSRVRQSFGALTQPQVEGIEAIIDGSRAGNPAGFEVAYKLDSDLPLHDLAYALATAWHETGTRMQPVLETFADTVDEAIRRLDNAWHRGRLRGVRTRYWLKDSKGRSWLGRGLPQTTHRENYAKADKLLGGVGLLEDPDLMLRMDVAVATMIGGMVTGFFRGRKFSDFKPEDYAGKRGIINGDKNLKDERGVPMGEKIAKYAREFEKALVAGGWKA